ncbi:hypothetical protein [Allokutzneria oryzae]|uniref:BON domain-containing protein n=1 Tax=Allokutzneria oryzae TaxID=1378989 RepID=A0ABV5ZU83_9PSEU
MSAFVVLVGCGQQPPQQHQIATTTPAPSAPHDENNPGDGAPHHRENNSWKQPRELSDEAKKPIEAAAEQIRPALEKVRDAKDITPESVRRVLTGLGHRAEAVTVEASSNAGIVVYGVSVGNGCVNGDVRAERVLAQVTGPVAEWGCMPVRDPH